MCIVSVRRLRKMLTLTGEESHVYHLTKLIRMRQPSDVLIAADILPCRTLMLAPLSSWHVIYSSYVCPSASDPSMSLLRAVEDKCSTLRAGRGARGCHDGCCQGDHHNRCEGPFVSCSGEHSLQAPARAANPGSCDPSGCNIPTQ